MKKQYARTAIKQLHARIGRKRLRGTFAVSYVGLGLPGAGAAATWKGLGFVNVNDGLGLPKRNLDGEALAETRTFLGNLEDKFNQLSDLLNDPGSTAGEEELVICRSVTKLSRLLYRRSVGLVTRTSCSFVIDVNFRL